MELPFLKNKNDMGGGTAVTRPADETSDEALTKHITEELMTSISKKDFKGIRQALQALVSIIKDNHA